MNPKLTLAFAFFISNLGIYGNAQTLLNGDFEINSLNSCAFNIDNVEFNAVVEDVYAFGTEDAMDIQTESCGYFPTISNDWYVSLGQRPNGLIDAISLKIDQPLEEGIMYQLSYFELADTTINPFNSNIPIGIGLSDDPSNFGDAIYSSTPVPDIWTLRTFEFTAPNGGQYITVRMAGALGLQGWNFVDGLKLAPLTDVLEAEKMGASVYPNPVRDWVNIETDIAVKTIRLFNALGQLVKSFPQVDAFYNRLDLSGVSAGVYFLEIMNEKGWVIKRVEKL